MNKPESISQSLLKSVNNDYSSDMLIETWQTVLDSGLAAVKASGILEQLPIIKSMLAFANGIVMYRERRYVNKILNFLAETSNASDEDYKKYQKKLDESPEEVNKAGETILDILDKVTSAEKAHMIGKVFHAYMREGELTANRMVHLCEMIERAYLEDLQNLAQGLPTNNANLESVGIRKPVRAEDINEALQRTANQSVSMATSQSGVIREAPANSRLARLQASPSYIKLKQSGLSEEGYQLQRILREY